MANNNWNNYTEKTATPVDADEVMVRDSTDGKNKKLLFGTFWKWVAKKLNEATISELQTSNKTIVGALNQLNSETLRTVYSGLITKTLNTIKFGYGFYLICTYRSGGYKISSLSLLNIQIQNGSFLETLVKGVDYDETINISVNEMDVSFQYKNEIINGGCNIKIYKIML